jgi:chromosome partitioning protein
MAMAWVISTAGQKGGVGKSILAQALAVDAALRGENVLLADLDIAQRTSSEWGEVRLHNGCEPRVKVAVIDPDRYRDFGVRQATGSCDLLVIDAPGWSDEKTLMLAGFSDVMVLPTGASVADLRPTIRLMHELVAGGIAKERFVTALCRVESPSEIQFARHYLQEAGFSTLKGVLRDMPTFRSLQNEGRTVIEASGKLREEARELIGSIRAALEREKGKRQAKPERFALSPERFQGRGR